MKQLQLGMLSAEHICCDVDRVNKVFQEGDRSMGRYLWRAVHSNIRYAARQLHHKNARVLALRLSDNTLRDLWSFSSFDRYCRFMDHEERVFRSRIRAAGLGWFIAV